MRYKRRHAFRRTIAGRPPVTIPDLAIPDLDRVARIIREVAEAEILPRFRRLEDHHAWEKRSGSIVTVADQAAEKRLEEAASWSLRPASITAPKPI